jgi:glutamate dehydrogenase (NAD(P)+)
MTPLPHPATPSAPLPTHALPSYLHAAELGPWGNYLQQVDRVIPHLGPLARWAARGNTTTAATRPGCRVPC